MVATVTILYPTGADSTFNLDYYLTKHYELVKEHWGNFGLTGYKVSKLAEPTDTTTPYSVQCILEFNSLADFQKAVDTAGPPVMGDIPNYSNKQPVIATGEVVLSA